MAIRSGSILLVEDEPALRNGFASLLAIEGFEVLCAADGNEALARLRVGTPRVALVLLDLQMPVVGGIEFRRLQLADPALASIPVIAYSGDFARLANVRELGVAECLKKPVSPEELLAAVRRVQPSGGDEHSAGLSRARRRRPRSADPHPVARARTA